VKSKRADLDGAIEIAITIKRYDKHPITQN